MLKQKFVFAVSLIAMVTVGIGAARADIASTVYVQQGVNSAKDAASAAQTSANNANTAAGAAQTSADDAQEAAEAAQASADAAAESAAAANAAVATKEASANKVTSISDTSTDTQYPSAKAVYTALSKKQNTLTIDSALSSTSTNPVQNKVINTALSGKQATLSEAQLSAANSGITSAKVTTYDGYASQISAKEASANKVTSISSSSTDAQYPSAKAVYTELAKKQNTLTIDSALSSSSTNPVQNKVINTALSGKQATLSAAQLSAANSGITLAKVSTYDGYATQISAKEASANKASSEGDVETIGRDIAYPTVAFMETSIANANTDVMTEVATKLNKTSSVKNAIVTTDGSGNVAPVEIVDSGTGTYVTDVAVSAGKVTLSRGTPASYSLPTASSTTLGGVKIGSNITNSSGTISVPAATSSALGVVKTGTNISNSSGTISVATGTPTALGVVKVGQIPSGSATSETYATIWVQ